VLENYLSDLLYLIGLGLITILLRIGSFFDSGFPEDMVASSYSFVEPQISQKVAELSEGDVGVGAAAENGF
jgi:hypothetical protein